MIPHIYIHEQFVRERVQERLREAEQERMLARLRKPRSSLLRYSMGRLGTFFVALGTSLQQLEQRNQQTVCEGESS